MFRNLLMAGLLFAAVRPAHANDWYEINAGNTQCMDMAAEAPAVGNPQLATPSGTQTLYQSVGEVVAQTQVKDATGAPIVVMHIKDTNGTPFLDFTFYPSQADCQYVLAQPAAH